MSAIDTPSHLNGNSSSNGSKIPLDLQDSDSIDDSWNYEFDENSLNVLNKEDDVSIDSKELLGAIDIENDSTNSHLNEKQLDDIITRNTDSKFPDPFQDKMSQTLTDCLGHSENSSHINMENDESSQYSSPSVIKSNSLSGSNNLDLKLSSSLSSNTSLTPLGIKSNPADPETTKRDILSASFTPSDSVNDLSIHGGENNASSKTLSRLDTKLNGPIDYTNTSTDIFSSTTPTTPSNSFFSTIRSITSVASSITGSGTVNSNGTAVSADSTPTLNGKQLLQHRRSISDISLDTPVTPTNSSSARFHSSGSKIIPEEDEEGKVEEVIGNDGTPNIISYRRTKRSRANTSSSTPKSPEINPLGSLHDENKIPIPMSPTVFEYDINLYVEEKYLDTQYRYATLKRNFEFHELFKSVPEDDRLLDDFSCALSREILLQGRLYVSEHYLCFNSNILGWVTNLVISLDDITGFEKRVTAGLFPNGIIVETKDAKHSFASFVGRDPTLNFLETIWSKSIALSETNGEPKRDVDELSGTLNNFTARYGNKQILTEKDIFTIDEDAPEDRSVHVNKDTNSSTPIPQASFEYKNDGPETHDPTDINFDCEANGETLLFSEVFPVPVGLLFNIFFSENTKFHKKIMSLTDGSNFSDYSKFSQADNNDDGTILERSFDYDRALGYSMGPKSTRVSCTERIEKKDYDSSIHVLTISKTPNVPSGGSFSVNTRYIFAWAENNHTKFQLSYKVNWTGRSMLKGVIERSTLSGQKAVSDVILSELKKLLETYSPSAGSGSVSTGLQQAPVLSADIVHAAAEKEKEKFEAERLETPNLKEPSSIFDTLTSVGTEFKEFLFSSDSKVFFALLVVFIELYSIWQLGASNKLLVSVTHEKDESLKLVLHELNEIKEKLNYITLNNEL